MATIDSAAREVAFKVVFYGPPGSGKATNLRYLHAQIDAVSRTEIRRSESTHDQRLSFSFRPRGITLLDHYKPRIDLLALTGEVVFNAARELLLRDVDGIVFVANSEWSAVPENVSSMESLRTILAQQNMGSHDVPYVLQFNKRDAENVAPREYLDFVLSNGHGPPPVYESTATSGHNVFATLNAVLERVFEKFAQRHPRHRVGVSSSRYSFLTRQNGATG